MKAIETEYAGCRFRSRLEARWAVVFDHLCIEWHYEPEGFEFRACQVSDRHKGEPCYCDVPVTRYLPDFFLPSIDAWFEVKGTEPTEAEMWAAAELAEWTRQKVYIAFGEIPREGTWRRTDTMHMFEHEGWDCGYDFAVCPHCGRIGIEFRGKYDRICRHTMEDRDFARDRRIKFAYEAGRSARFEFGESGAARR